MARLFERPFKMVGDNNVALLCAREDRFDALAIILQAVFAAATLT